MFTFDIEEILRALTEKNSVEWAYLIAGIFRSYYTEMRLIDYFVTFLNTDLNGTLYLRLSVILQIKPRNEAEMNVARRLIRTNPYVVRTTLVDRRLLSKLFSVLNLNSAQDLLLFRKLVDSEEQNVDAAIQLLVPDVEQMQRLIFEQVQYSTMLY